MWTKKPMPTIQGLETSNAFEAKRWLDFRLSDLLDDKSPVAEQAKALASREEVCRFVIEKIDYPIVRGRPNDSHKNNWFGGLCCYSLSLDFFQRASETLRTYRLGKKNDKKGYGDCEDTSILFTDLFLINRWKAYECFGQVFEGEELLGGHGWAIFQDEGGDWRLYESTLSAAPSYPRGYPVIDPDADVWKIGDIDYVPQAKFNKKEYYEIREGLSLGYLALKMKEAKKKYKAIQRAWIAPAKPIVQAGILGKLRRW